MNKIEKLELKHICGYLPWGLTGFHKEGHICNIDFDMVVKYGTNLANYKPLLFPLSSLTEQLPDGSIPIDTISEFNIGYVDFMTSEREHWIEMYGMERYIGSIPLMIIEYLYSIHADIYGLIDSGLAIDKRTVKL